ncbi:hypothetical protein BV25DRAFT_1308286 [Artomyces pyxidatus]|uniref:Uncharacterized protein n=1 Tax=Artomyces pyxidatus TaxID=48021 RepID=A0ACB8SQ35_9AGAM|nr:hypothetical protein BV25DRAFT_1308286 [Artomyces pyxidatus]
MEIGDIATWDGDISMVRRLSLKGRMCVITWVDGRAVSIVSDSSQRCTVPSRILHVLSSGPAPAYLESLALGPFPPDHDPRPSILFDNFVPPSLKHVALRYMIVTPYLCIFRARLTSLDLRYSQVWETMEDLLEALCRLPSLQSLILEESGPKDRFTEPPQPSNSVVLPHLRNLEFISGAEPTMALLDRLSIPDDVWLTVGIAVDTKPDGETDQREYLSGLLHAHLPDGLYYSLRFHAFSIMPYIIQGKSSGFIFQFSCPWLVQDGPGWSRPLPSLGLKIRWSARDHPPATDHVPAIIDAFIDRLTALTVGCPDVTSEVWQSIAPRINTVECITVSDRAAALGLFSALASDSPKPLFPRLRTIGFERMTLGDGRSKVDEDNGEETLLPVGWSVLDRFMRVMDSRGTIELGIRLVVIAQCDVEAPMVEALQRHLGYHTVHWDGITNGFCTYYSTIAEVSEAAPCSVAHN